MHPERTSVVELLKREDVKLTRRMVLVIISGVTCRSFFHQNLDSLPSDPVFKQQATRLVKEDPSWFVKTIILTR